MEIEQAFDDVTPGGRKLGKFQYFLFSTVTLGQVLLACQMCLMGKVNQITVIPTRGLGCFRPGINWTWTTSVWLTSTKVVLTPLLTTEGNPFLLLTATDCSKASSIFQLGVLFGNLLIGPITDTKGRKIPFFVCSFLIILVQGIFHNQIVHALVHQVIPSIIDGIHGP